VRKRPWRWRGKEKVRGKESERESLPERESAREIKKNLTDKGVKE